MFDEFFTGIISSVIIVLALAGIVFFVQIPTTETLPNFKWNCTESKILDGKAQCIKYERKG